MAIDVKWVEDQTLPLPPVEELDMHDTLEHVLSLFGNFEENLKVFIQILESSQWARKKSSVLTFLDVTLKYAVNIEVREAINFVIMAMKSKELDMGAVQRSLKIAQQQDSRTPDAIESATKTLDTFEKMNEALSNSSLLSPEDPDKD
jgi:hypothetical protein